jgi:Sec-independent protein translocase protein TatA
VNILGVGGWELLAILLIMLIVAGPKRMIHWSYILGQYVSKFRAMWSETVDVIQKEFDDAGVGIQLPKDVPTRGSLNKQAGKALESITRPVKETMDKTATEVNQIKNATAVTAKTASTVASGNGHAAKPKTPRPPKPKQSNENSFGTWSGENKNPDFGTWSGKNDTEE